MRIRVFKTRLKLEVVRKGKVEVNLPSSAFRSENFMPPLKWKKQTRNETVVKLKLEKWREFWRILFVHRPEFFLPIRYSIVDVTLSRVLFF